MLILNSKSRRRAFEAGDEYAKAQWTGRVEEDCSAYHRRCDMDLFEVMYTWTPL